MNHLKGLILLALLLSACSMNMGTGDGQNQQPRQQNTPVSQAQEGIPDSYSQTGTGGMALYTAMQQQKCTPQDPVGGPDTESVTTTGNHPIDQAYAIAHCPGNIYRVFLWDHLEGTRVRMSRIFTKKDRIWTLDPTSNSMNWLVVLTLHSACGTTTIWVTWYPDPGRPDSIPPLIRVSGPC